MLFLLFQIGPGRYAMDIRQIAEILPVVQITPLPQLPAVVAGVFNYRGTPVPVIDLSQLLLQRPALKRFNTRLVVVRHLDESGAPHLVGLIAERATDTVRRHPDEFTASGLGPLAAEAGGFVQRTDLRQLLPGSLQDLLFRTPLVPP